MKQPRPFFRKYTKTWYVEIDGKQINLGRDKKAAWDKYHRLMARRHELISETVTVASLFDEYLGWTLRRKARSTYQHAKFYLSSFVTSVGKRLKVGGLKPTHITKWIDQHESWSDTTRNDAISHVQRAFSWAVNQKYLERSPVDKIEDKPARRRREVVYSPDQWQEIMSHVRDEPFRDLLRFMWETGCRPLEARLLEARHVDLKNSLAIFPPSEGKKERERMIVLTKEAAEICRRLCAKFPQGPIFRNRNGRPWTRDAIKCRFTRIKQKVKIDGLCAYGIRHSYATEGLKNGVDSLTLATLMGHADVSMIARTYQHLARNLDYLREQARRAKGRDD